MCVDIVTDTLDISSFGSKVSKVLRYQQHCNQSPYGETKPDIFTVLKVSVSEFLNIINQQFLCFRILY